MKFQPKTAEEIAREDLLPKGEYDFEVVTAEEKTSKTGNEMIALNIRVFSGTTGANFVRDFLLEKIAYKLRHFCEATGLLPKYENGTLTADDCEGKVGRLKLVVKEDKTGTYPPQNSVADYIVPKAGEPEEEDDIPF
jgi:cobalamin biosynthesis protein CbiG